MFINIYRGQITMTSMELGKASVWTRAHVAGKILWKNSQGDRYIRDGKGSGMFGVGIK